MSLHVGRIFPELPADPCRAADVLNIAPWLPATHAEPRTEDVVHTSPDASHTRPIIRSHTLPAAPAELRIEDVVGDVVDLAQAADPQRITAAGVAAAAWRHHVTWVAGCGLLLGMLSWVTLVRWCELCTDNAPTHPRCPAANAARPVGADLQRCGAAGTIIGLLADVNLFYEYENREQVLAQAAQAAQEQQQS